MENELLDYSAYTLIKSFEGYGKKFRFNKFMYLLNKELQKEGIELNLPYYWYNYGVVIHNNNYFLNLNGYEINEDSISPTIKTVIVDKITKLIKMYKYKSTGEINDCLYKKAPFKFQEDFKDLIKIIKDWENNSNTISEDEYQKIYILLQNISLDFPEGEFKELYPLFLEWENYLSNLIKTDYSKQDIHSFVFKFWFTFTKKLQTMTSENIDAETINNWKKEYKTKFNDLEEYLFDFSFKYFSDYPESSLDDLKSLEELHKQASKVIWSK